jgi:hypothetical protein
VVTDTELIKSGGEVNRVPIKEVSMDTIECSINLAYKPTNESGVYTTVLG